MDLARYIVDAVVLEGRSYGEVARSHGVSKSWVAKLVWRFSFGLCAPRRGIDPDGVHGLMVRNLRLDVEVTLLNLKSRVVRQINETWGAPITTFPIATPFSIGGAGAPGSGSIFTRIFLGCPPAGSPAARFTWTQVT